jgi:hypothetical protein
MAAAQLLGNFAADISGVLQEGTYMIGVQQRSF